MKNFFGKYDFIIAIEDFQFVNVKHSLRSLNLFVKKRKSLYFKGNSALFTMILLNLLQRLNFTRESNGVFQNQ